MQDAIALQLSWVAVCGHDSHVSYSWWVEKQGGHPARRVCRVGLHDGLPE